MEATLTFAENMVTAHVPPASYFTFLLSGVARVPDVIHWITPKLLNFTFIAPPPTDSVVSSYDGLDTFFQTTTGQKITAWTSVEHTHY